MQKIMFNDRYGLTDAVLRGSKTQTRRIVYDFRNHASNKVGKCVLLDNNNITYMDGEMQVLDELPKPKYKVGEVVAVAQSYKDAGYNIESEYKHRVTFRNGNGILTNVAKGGWSNKMFVSAERMPHHIRITGIRVQRLQDISDEDCIKEGIEWCPNGFYVSYNSSTGARMWFGVKESRSAYAALIDRVSGKGTWDSNPFVVAYEFELVD